MAVQCVPPALLRRSTGLQQLEGIAFWWWRQPGLSSVGGTVPSEPETLHLQFQRQLLGLPASTPTATVLAELGEPPLYVRWLLHAARFWNSLVAAPAGSVMQQALETALQLAADCEDLEPAQQPWAAQLAAALQCVGVEFDPQQQQQLSADGVRQAAMQRHLSSVATAAAQPQHTLLRHYLVRPEACTLDGYSRAEYVTAVRELRWRRGLTELRTSKHWGAEETGRHRRVAREQRLCPHCVAAEQPGGVENTHHIVFVCPLYATERAR